jgi:hypothetical protein
MHARFWGGSPLLFAASTVTTLGLGRRGVRVARAIGALEIAAGVFVIARAEGLVTLAPSA